MSVLVAGIGNIFHGDDGFGVEVAQRLLRRALPDGVRVVDFGIRGWDLAYALVDGPDTTILVDAHSRGGAPGTLYTVEIDPAADVNSTEPANAHSMDPVRVLQLAQSLGGCPGRILLVGCEPETFGSEEEGQMGLSDSVAAAVEPAVDLVLRLATA